MMGQWPARWVTTYGEVIEESQSKVFEVPIINKPVVKKEETNKVTEKKKCGNAVEEAVASNVMEEVSSDKPVMNKEEMTNQVEMGICGKAVEVAKTKREHNNQGDQIEKVG